ncbi:uncharacterized protein LOC105433662 [Pogonomyrmex barbatus]|uniref:Uncharacterized protein LOC105433662 n=1 Tax=Pogonomyrmex barbatus TaxID=144034 RepID=A0A6I9WTH6_9HYME|nr:uncharacterized protein LOC105433662 [Pogonomyrmex barbatus]
MARDNETNTLELHVKINRQNLSAISEKCNISTLRIPSDPSWPKIPLRRSNNNTDDIIEPPCVVTLTGTPRKGCSTMQTVTRLHLKSRSSQEYEAITHIPKRLPGCFDPRFRRQISRQKAEKPDESYNRKNDKQTLELDTCIPQESKKLEDKSRETSEYMNDYVLPYHDVDNLLENVTKSAKEMDNCSKEVNEPLFLMVDEKKIHALPISTLNIEADSSSPKQSLQCYSVQIPVIAYHNVPLQLSDNLKQIGKDIKILSAYQNNNVKDREAVGNICTRSTLTNLMHSSKKSGNQRYLFDNVEQCDAKNSDDICHISEKKSISMNCDGRPFGRILAKENTDSNVESSNQDIRNETTSRTDRNGDNDTIDELHQASNVRNGEKFVSLIDQRCDTNSCTANKCNERNKIRDKESRKSNEEEKRINMKEKRGQLRVNVKHKAASMNLSRKAKSFFRKKSRLAITDSDCTLILPGPHGINGKRYEKIRGRSKINQSSNRLDQRNRMISTNSILESNAKSKQSRINSRSLTNLRAKNLVKKPLSVPLETRELLNKSYWEYYWKLKHRIASAKPDNAEERDKCSNEPQDDHLLESQTLQQCSILSCMINTALRNSAVVQDKKSFSYPAVNVMCYSNACENIYETSRLSSAIVKRINRKKMNRTNKRLFRLEIMALLCIAIYVAIIFLPVMYDYFFNDEDENVSYIELTFRYVASSFGEAVDGIINVLTTTFLQSVRSGRKQ